MYVKCLILKNHSLFLKEYTYFIPTKYELEVDVNSLVIVPFNNTLYVALVTSIIEDVDFLVKDICGVFSNFVTSNLVKLFNYLEKNSFNSINYLYTTKLIPSFLRPKVNVLYRLVDSSNELYKDFKDGSYKLDKYIKEGLNCGALKKVKFINPLEFYKVNKLNRLVDVVYKLDIDLSFSYTLVNSTTLSSMYNFLLNKINDAISLNKSILLVFNTIEELNRVYSYLLNLGIYSYRYTSTCKKSELKELYSSLVFNNPTIVLGLTDSLFLPFLSLSSIILFNPDSYYHTPSNPNFSGIKAFIYLARLFDAPIYNISYFFDFTHFYHKDNYLFLDDFKDKNYSLIDLYKSVDPTISSVLSLHSINLIKKNLADGKTTSIVVPTFGYANTLYCLSCGKIRICPNCLGTLRYYKDKDIFKCSKCFKTYPTSLKCSCNSNDFLCLNAGLEKVYFDLDKLFKGSLYLYDGVYKKSKIVLSTTSIFTSKYIDDINSVIFVGFDRFINSFLYYKYLYNVFYLEANYKVRDFYIETYKIDDPFFNTINYTYNDIYNLFLNKSSNIEIPYVKKYKLLIFAEDEDRRHAYNAISKVLGNSNTVIDLSESFLEEHFDKVALGFYLTLPLSASFSKYVLRIKGIIKKIDCYIKVGD